MKLPGMALRRRAALAARARQNPSRSTPRPPKPRPACCAVLTARRLEGGRLRRPAGACRPQAARRLAVLQAALSGAGRGPRALGRRFGRLRRRRDASAGDRRRRADRRSITSRCRPSSPPPRRSSPGAPRVWDDCPDNICFVQLMATRPRPTRPSPGPRTWSNSSFVINRVTAATMEPRGGVGVYEPADGRYTVYTTLQRAASDPHRARAMC